MAYSILAMGPPGTGKSYFCASVADVCERVLLLATKPRESLSYGYASRKNIDARLYFDAKWRPSLDKFEADGFLRLVRDLFTLMDDDTYDAVILDPLTDAAELVYHELLKFEQAATPRDTRDSQSYYGALRAKMNELVKAVTQLQFAKRPKHVLVTCHLQPMKETDTRSQGKTADKRAQGVMFEGGALPAFEGSAKYTVAGDFDAVLYTDVLTKTAIVDGKATPQTQYIMKVRPDNEMHAKIAVAPALAEATIANDFTAFLKAIGALPPSANGKGGRK